MPGPPPKPPSLRLRRNRAGGVVVLPYAPPAKAPKPLAGWCERTVVWWEAIWRSPMASMWIEVDVAGLERLGVMVDEANRGQGTAALLGEIRQLEDRYGLSPMGRRRLQWEMPAPAVDGEPESPPPNDEERFLRAVS